MSNHQLKIALKRQKRSRIFAGILGGITIGAISLSFLAPPIMIPVAVTFFFASFISSLASIFFGRKIKRLKKSEQLIKSNHTAKLLDEDTNVEHDHSRDIKARFTTPSKEPISEEPSTGESKTPQELLYEGCKELDFEKVSHAIAKGADVNLKTPAEYNTIYGSKMGCRYTPLSLVAYAGEARLSLVSLSGTDTKACQIATLLLDNGADVDQLDTGDMGNSSLHWAIVSFKKNLSILLIDHAIHHQKNLVNLSNQPEHFAWGSNPPLVLALKVSIESLNHGELDLDVANHLLNAGADVNALGSYRQSALHWAAILRCPESFFKRLLAKNPQYGNDFYGKTPGQLYNESLTEDKINILKHKFTTSGKLVRISNPSPSFQEIGFHLKPELNDTTKSKQMRIINYRNQCYQSGVVELLAPLEAPLIEYKEKKEAEDRFNKSVSSRGKTDLNHKDNLGRTPLHRAVVQGDSKLFNALINAGADVSQRDNQGLTPLELVRFLKEKLTYKVPPTFFSSQEGCIKPKQYEAWEDFERILVRMAPIDDMKEDCTSGRNKLH